MAINKTWYRDENGNRFFQMHYGYINEQGKMVIPAMFEDASPFNVYGVAAVCVNYFDIYSYYFIDTKGNKINNIDYTWINMHHREDKDRFIEFSTDPSYSDWDDKTVLAYLTVREKRLFIRRSLIVLLSIRIKSRLFLSMMIRFIEKSMLTTMVMRSK